MRHLLICFGRDGISTVTDIGGGGSRSDSSSSGPVSLSRNRACLVEPGTATEISRQMRPLIVEPSDAAQQRPVYDERTYGGELRSFKTSLAMLTQPPHLLNMSNNTDHVLLWPGGLQKQQLCSNWLASLSFPATGAHNPSSTTDLSITPDGMTC